MKHEWEIIYRDSSMASLHLTLSALDRSKSCQIHFEQYQLVVVDLYIVDNILLWM